MAILRRRNWCLGLAAGLMLSAASGCQTYWWETGQTLPSGYYLKHPPQYFPPTPDFPLPREEAGLEQAYTRMQQNGTVLPPR
jgi:hypothetical protein